MKSGQDESKVVRATPQMLKLNDYIPAVLTWVYNRLSSDASKSYRQWHGVGVTDWRVLAFLGVNKQGTAAAIGRIINLDKAATSRSIAFLKARHFVKTQQMPGRNVLLTLTEQGRKKFNEIATHALDREAALLEGFSNAEKALLNKMLHRMLANLDRVSGVVPRASSKPR